MSHTGLMASSLMIAVARHGQTDSNVRGLWVGSGDDPLNEMGRKQAEDLAKSLSDFKFDFVISSDKKRAVETALIVSRILDIPVFGHHSTLRDREYGELEGLTTDQIRERYGVEMKSLSREIDDLGSAEPVNSVMKRVRDFVNTAMDAFNGKKFIVITHGAFIRSFYEMYVGNSEGIRFTNCSNFIVKFSEDGPEVVRDIMTI
ncbi:MAG: histidine phosphatase family protein [Thermoplasmata archaeon]